MTVVKLHQLGTGKRLKLDATQTKLFVRELARVKKSPAGGPPPALLGADCRIVVTTAGKTRTYELYARSVIFDPKAKKSWQLYFGLLLLEWLDTIP